MRRKVLHAFLGIISTFHVLFAQQVDTDIQNIIAETNLDSLTHFVKELSGEIQINLAGAPDTIMSRNVNHEGNDKAADYIIQKLGSYGLTTFDQFFGAAGRNVYGVQTGSERPNQMYLICAHYDNMPYDNIAPGADDNASGTAAVIEAARILMNYPTKYTVVYALWDEEEMGLIGSRYYAAQASMKGDSILGVINLDMIGWDSNDDGIVEIHSSNVGNSTDLSNHLISVNTIYNLSLTPAAYNPGINGSDHRAFWENGYSAILLIEGYRTGDFNQYYHTINDKIANFNLTFFHNCSKLAIAALASLVEVQAITPVEEIYQYPGEFNLEPNYPNPFNASTTITYAIPKPGFITLKIFDLNGRDITTLVSKFQEANTYSIHFNASRFPSGIYFYRLQFGRRFVKTKKMLLIR